MEPELACHNSSAERSLDRSLNADEWGELTPEKRMKRCHLMAERAQLLAKTAPSEIAERYLQIANDWLQLATEMQQLDAGRHQQKG